MLLIPLLLACSSAPEMPPPTLETPAAQGGGEDSGPGTPAPETPDGPPAKQLQDDPADEVTVASPAEPDPEAVSEGTPDPAPEAASPEEPSPSQAPVAEAPVVEASAEEPAEAPAPEAEEPTPPEPEATGPVHYALTTQGSSLYVQVFKDTSTAASGISHDHVMRASGWTGTATWDPENPSACKIDVSVPVDKLVVDPPKLREAVGYEAPLSDGQRGDVRKNMLSKDQLNSSKYPTISFQATGCKAAGGDTVDVSGTLTIKGKSQPVTVRMTLSGDGERFSAKGSFKVKGSDYGLEPYSAMMGALKNRDELRFTVRLSGTAK